MVHCGRRGMDVFSNNTQLYCDIRNMLNLEPHFECSHNCESNIKTHQSDLVPADWMRSSPDYVYITKCMSEMGVN